MRRRHGTAFVLVGVCVGLAPGCLATMAERAASVPDRPAAAPPAASSPSPYHVTTAEPPPRPVPERVAPPDVQTAVAPAAPPEPPRDAVSPPADKVVLVRPPDDSPLIEALRQLLNDRAGEAGPLLQGYNESDGKLILNLLQTAARCADHGPSDRASLDVQLQSLAAALRERAPLKLDALRFCSEVKGFGVFRPMRADGQGRFNYQAGADGLPGEPMQLYLEVRNFYSRKLDDGYETRLGARVEIIGAGNLVAQFPLKPHQEHSLSPRQDYFIALTIPVPARLPPGEYTLWVEVWDETELPGRPPAQRKDRRSLDFSVVDRAARAGSD